MKESLEYFNNNELANNVWRSKYALRKNKEIFENTPNDMHERMAMQFARMEGKYKNPLQKETIFNLLQGFKKIIPQGSVMSQLGNPFQIGSLSNCVVLPEIHDSYGGIGYADQQLVQLMKRRCGVGLDISPLRPSGSFVSNAAQSSTGAVSFMPRLSNSTREVAQDGRRGALMISIDIRHPESEIFTTSKQDLTKITGANISLRIVDEFMHCVQKNTPFFQRFPINVLAPDISEIDDMPFNELQTWANAQVKKVDANKLWDVIIKCAHNTAEPGLIFWDRQHRYSPSSLYKEFCNISTNPCSEIAMGNDSCRLIAANIFSCVLFPFTSKANFDFEDWYSICYNQQKLLDDLVDLELEAIDRILTKIKSDKEPEYIKAIEIKTWEDLKKSAERGRRTGGGFTALADALAALGVKYDSEEGLKIAAQIARIKLVAELDATIDMAEERGAFPAFDATLEAKLAEENDTFFYMLKNEFPIQWERMQKVGRRNISWSTVAPTGSLSLLCNLQGRFWGTTSGIEPLFSVYHIRRKKINPSDVDTRVDFIDDLGDKWQEFKVFHAGFEMWWQINHPEQSMHDLTKSELDEAIANSPYGGSTAGEISWEKRIELQSIIQKYTTHSISSTINLPNNATIDEISQIYFKAWELGLKGITVYRDGSRSGVLITESSKPKEEFHYHNAPKRPKELKAELNTVSVKGQRYAVVLGFLDGKPYEVFAFKIEDESFDYAPKSSGVIIKEKSGNYHYIASGEKRITVPDIGNMAAHADEQMLTRLLSGMLRHGVNPKFLIEQIDKCPLEVVSFGKALSRIIKKYIPEKELLERFKCKDCGSSNVRFEESCAKCLDCGSSKCG